MSRIGDTAAGVVLVLSIKRERALVFAVKVVAGGGDPVGDCAGVERKRKKVEGGVLGLQGWGTVVEVFSQRETVMLGCEPFGISFLMDLYAKEKSREGKVI